MKLVCVGHAIKEVLSASESLAAMERGARQAGILNISQFLISDGGDGLLEIYRNCRNAITELIPSIDALGRAHYVPILWDPERLTSAIEIAQCIGLAQVDPSQRDIMKSGSAGVADLILAARSNGVRKIVIGLGGSATCDGGIGLLWRLARLSGQCSDECREIKTAGDMAEVPSPDITGLQDWLIDIEIEAWVDVDNPLLGANGAAHAFAAQKGASLKQVAQLESYMQVWSEKVERNANNQWRDNPGAGAAGGLGFAFASIGAKLVPGALASMSFTGLDRAISRGCMVITTEGRFDATSLNGKAPWTVAEKAIQKKAGVGIICGLADAASVSQANMHGVSILEYGCGLEKGEFVRETPERIANAVATFLGAKIGTTSRSSTIL